MSSLQTVAIVIPCRNEKDYIGKCLDSILKQDYSADKISIYVCDGLSTDGTDAIVKEYVSKHPHVHFLINERQTTPFALNLGIKTSASDVLIILGAHSELYPDYISNSLIAFENGANIGCTGGIIENVYENDVAEMIGKAMSSGFGVGNAYFRTGAKGGFVDTVAFGAYRREVFEKVGYFDEELIRNQDDEFNYRVIKSGFFIYLSLKIRCKYYVRGSLQKLYKQYYQYGYWKVYVGKKHKAVTSIRQLVPLAFVLFLFLGLVASPFSRFAFALYLAGILFYAATSVYSAFKVSGNFKQALQVAKVFFILHFSYGSGYLFGMFDFLLLRKKIKKEEALTR